MDLAVSDDTSVGDEEETSRLSSAGACSPNLLISTGVDEGCGDWIGWICSASTLGISAGLLAFSSVDTA